MFPDWPELSIWLDIWHLIRRLSVGYTTDANALYATFMSRLNHCIYKWDLEDVEALIAAKKYKLEAMHVENQTNSMMFFATSRAVNWPCAVGERLEVLRRPPASSPN